MIFYYLGKMVCLYLRKNKRFPRSTHDIKDNFTSFEKNEFGLLNKKFRRVGIVGPIVIFILTILIVAINTEWKL